MRVDANLRGKGQKTTLAIAEVKAYLRTFEDPIRTQETTQMGGWISSCPPSSSIQPDEIWYVWVRLVLSPVSVPCFFEGHRGLS